MSVSVSESTNGNVNMNSMSDTSNARKETHALRCKVMPILLRLAGDTDWQVRFISMLTHRHEHTVQWVYVRGSFSSASV